MSSKIGSDRRRWASPLALLLWALLALMAAACGGDGDDQPPREGCGNGIRERAERCDDGNPVDGDGCDSNCTSTGCGNGVAAGGEACDDGNLVSGDGCDENCTISVCGNGIAAAGEACDDGNLTDGDGCDGSCTRTRCGNGVATAGEACDDGNLVNGDGCDVNCTISACGNGIATTGEACDDGNLTDGDGCDRNCTLTKCGNGIATAGEACDDGNLVNGDGCDVSCTISECGNLVPAGTEECDDGNLTNGDGCDANCTITACGNDVTAAGEVCDDGNLADGDGCDSNCTPTGCGNGIATGAEVCDDGNLTNGDGCDVGCTLSHRAYVKASNTGADDRFGSSIALSADGSTLAVGVPNEDSAATGVNGDQLDESGFDSGAVYVFVRVGATWVQQAYLKASNTGGGDGFATGDQFGGSVALSADGSTLAVGASREDSAVTGVNGNQADNSAQNAGAAYVFTRAGATWTQQAYLKASNTGANDDFGVEVALSGDGSILAVGARAEDSAATGVGGNQASNSALDAGAVYVFARSGATWGQQAYLKASNTGADDNFGRSIALSGDGSILAVGAIGEDSAAVGVGGDQASNAAPQSGAVYVFARAGTAWAQQAYVKSSNTGASDTFGFDLALSAEGSTLAVGAIGEASAATGVGGDQTSNVAPSAGAVYVFARAGAAWSQQAYVKASNTDFADRFGFSVALSADGSMLAVGADEEDGSAAVIGGPDDDLASAAGAAYRFARSGATWTQRTYVKASNTGAADHFGHSIALSASGSTLAVGADFESSASTDVDGDQASNSATRAGAVYLIY